ncbi:nucleoside-diphosphate-sugar epimerase [Oxalobacteraceae bacterium GrIS 2.11]
MALFWVHSIFTIQVSNFDDMKVCVTGSAGFIGSILASRLRSDGVELRLLTRQVIADNDEYFTADLTDNAASLQGLLDDVEVIYHCAGETKNIAKMASLHVLGTRKMLDAVSNHIAATGKPLHWVQLSSVGAYGPPKGRADTVREILETTEAAPVGEYEVTKTQADELIIDYAQREPLFTYSILRPSIVIGKNMTNQSVRSLVNVIRRKLFFYIGSTSAVATYVHVDDVVDALVLCGTDVRAKGQIFNLSNDCKLSEVVAAVAQRAGIAAPTLCVPERLLRVLVNVFSYAGKIPLTQDRIDAMVKRTRYSNEKIAKVLGYTPSRSIPRSIASLFDE